MASPAEVRPLLVGGEWITTGNTLPSVNPATGETNYQVAAADAALTGAAVENAERAAASPAWRDLRPQERAAILRRIGDLIDAQRETFARAQMIENGKVWSECLAQARSAAATFRYYAAVCETVSSEVTPARGSYLSMTVFEPYGVVLAITPWNSPLTLEAQKVAPALAAGNAIVLKPSEITSSPALELGRVALEAGLPPGVLNIVPGTGATVGKALVEHPGVRMVTFTGGTESGRHIGQVAARRLVPSSLELGGKSPHIVFADADRNGAIDAILKGIFEGSGQSCIAGSRVFVERAIYAEMAEALVAAANGLRVGLPEQGGTQLGPIASFQSRERIERIVDEARASGARIIAGGIRPDAPELARGAFYRPTIIEGIDNDAPAAQQEIFGPVLCLLPFDGEDDLVRQANGTAFGLAAGIWTADFPRAWRIARLLDAGTVWINTYKELSISTPFGGFKDSGIGREKGVAGMRLYQQCKGIYVGLGAATRQ